MSGLTWISIRRGAGCGAFALNHPDNMPPRPLELIVMLAKACCLVSVNVVGMLLRSMLRICDVLGRPVISAMYCCK